MKKVGLRREELLRGVQSNFSDYEYFKLLSKAAFADLEDPTDKFGSWINFMKDLKAKRFDKLF